MWVTISLVWWNVIDNLTRTQHRYEIPMPMKMISYVLYDVNSSFEGYVGVKIWKGAYLLEKSFYWVSIIYQVHNDGFIRTSFDLSDMH